MKMAARRRRWYIMKMSLVLMYDDEDDVGVCVEQCFCTYFVDVPAGGPALPLRDCPSTQYMSSPGSLRVSGSPCSGPPKRSPYSGPPSGCVYIYIYITVSSKV